jgi:predicted nucleic acid-binding protein
MKILICYSFLYDLLFSDQKIQKQKEKYLTDCIKKNERLFISTLTLHEIYNQCSFEVFEELSVQFEILTEDILPFTEIISKLEKNYKKINSSFPLERATAGVYGIDKLLTSDGLVSIVNI